MAEIGIRDLKARASEIVRSVRELRTRYIITHRGRPVGMLIPFDESGTPENEDHETAWNELLQLGRAIGRGWKARKTSTELLGSMRR